MADQDKVRVQDDDSDAEIRRTEEDMRRYGEEERRYRNPSFMDRMFTAPRELESGARESHEAMQKASERGMALRRGRQKVRDLKSALEGAMGAGLGKRRSPKRRN